MIFAKLICAVRGHDRPSVGLHAMLNLLTLRNDIEVHCMRCKCVLEAKPKPPQQNESE